MHLTSKRDLKKIWADIVPLLPISSLETLTDIEYSIGWDKTTYILIELNSTHVFFIFDTDGPYVKMFSHKQIPSDVVEVAMTIKKQLTNRVYSKQMKVLKSD